ncbi:MAG: hypothetical protein JRJ26_14850 [Deltaproteobacteria bacterium]|nr:hypothetical protein [Deltaproteobacteria bacterium]
MEIAHTLITDDQSTPELSIKGEYSRMWQGWIIGLLGVWLIIASFIFNGNVLNELGVGVSVAVIGFWAAVG